MKIRAVLHGGPFNQELRDITTDPQGSAPEQFYVMDAVLTFEDIIDLHLNGTGVPLSYQVYKRVKYTMGGVWWYQHAGSSSGRFIADG